MSNSVVQVLVIESDPQLCAQLVSYVENHLQFVVHTAGSNHEAHKALSQQSVPYQIALMSDKIKLYPNQSRVAKGTALLHQIKKYAPNCAVILYTRESIEEKRMHAIREVGYFDAVSNLLEFGKFFEQEFGL